MSEIKKNSRNYIGYDYKEIYAQSSKVSIYLDGYRNFGWEPDGNWNTAKNAGKVMLRLKRDRKIINKTELTRLQQHFEDCMKQIDVLEQSKTTKANIAAISTGIIGTMFITGATFAAVNVPPIIWLCILLAVPGFAGWILPYFIFRKITVKRGEMIAPLIEDKFDEIHEICEKGSRLLSNR